MPPSFCPPPLAPFDTLLEIFGGIGALGLCAGAEEEPSVLPGPLKGSLGFEGVEASAEGLPQRLPIFAYLGFGIRVWEREREKDLSLGAQSMVSRVFGAVDNTLAVAV